MGRVPAAGDHAHRRRLHPRLRRLPARPHPGAGRSGSDLHRALAGLRATPAGAVPVGGLAAAPPDRRAVGRHRGEPEHGAQRGGGFPRRAHCVGLVGWTRAHRHCRPVRRHARGRLLPAARLGPDGRARRRARPSRPCRHDPRHRPRHRPRGGGLRARAGHGVPRAGHVLRARADADRRQFRPADRPVRGAHLVRALRRLDHRARPVGRRGAGAVLARRRLRAAGADGNRLLRRTVPGRERPAAQAGRRACRPAPGLAHVRAVRLRLAVRLHRPARGRARQRRHRRARALRHRALRRVRLLPRARTGREPRSGAGARGVSAQLDFGFRVPPEQLVLDWRWPVEPARDATVETPALAPALALVDRWPAWPAPVAALVGLAGSGKSHIARLWAARAEAHPLAPERLDGLDPAPLGARAVLIEDLSAAVLGRHAAAVGLFHLLNHVRGQGSFVLMTARSDPARWPLALPDLASRLAAAALVEMPAPDEATMRAVMARLLAERQMPSDPAILDAAVPRLDRSLAACRDLVRRLDRTALATRRPVSPRMVRELL